VSFNGGGCPPRKHPVEGDNLYKSYVFSHFRFLDACLEGEKIFTKLHSVTVYFFTEKLYAFLTKKTAKGGGSPPLKRPVEGDNIFKTYFFTFSV
jgi:hypothetical protein